MNVEVLKSIIAGNTRIAYLDVATDMENAAKHCEEQALKLLSMAEGHQLAAKKCREIAKDMKEGIQPITDEELPELKD